MKQSTAINWLIVLLTAAIVLFAYRNYLTDQELNNYKIHASVVQAQAGKALSLVAEWEKLFKEYCYDTDSIILPEDNK